MCGACAGHCALNNSGRISAEVPRNENVPSPEKAVGSGSISMTATAMGIRPQRSKPGPRFRRQIRTSAVLPSKQKNPNLLRLFGCRIFQAMFYFRPKVDTLNPPGGTSFATVCRNHAGGRLDGCRECWPRLVTGGWPGAILMGTDQATRSTFAGPAAFPSIAWIGRRLQLSGNGVGSNQGRVVAQTSQPRHQAMGCAARRKPVEVIIALLFVRLHRQ
jgi:hypothetical protein